MPVSFWINQLINTVRKEITLHPRIYLAFQVVFMVWSLYWWWKPPDPGKAVLLLAAVAAVVTIQPHMTDKHRLAWLAIVFILFFVEFRSINLDRDKRAEKERQARREEAQNFMDIGEGIRDSIAQSQRHFDTTMSRIETTLKTSEATLRNTRPFASLEFQKMLFYSPSLPVTTNRPLKFNVMFTNNGNDVAMNAHIAAKLYVRKLHDGEAQREITSAFEQWWRGTEGEKHIDFTIKPHAPNFSSFASDSFTQEEVNGLLDRSMTLYLIVRFDWLDKTGRWATDECYWMQDPMHDLMVMLPCEYPGKYRYLNKRLSIPKN